MTIDSYASKVRRGVAVCRNAVTDFLFPPVCPLCGGPPSRADSLPTPTFCEDCRRLVCPAIPRACEVCGAPVGPFANTSGCPECQWHRPAYRRVIRLGVYENLLRKACIRAKDNHQEAIMAACARLLAEERREAFDEAQADVLIPVPQHWSHRIARSHNAAEVMARVLSSLLDLPANTDLLLRSRRTQPQKRASSVQARRENQRGAFRLACPDTLKGRRIVLVDDILTTGATAHEAARVLTKAGGRVVAAAVVARVLSRQSAT